MAHLHSGVQEMVDVWETTDAAQEMAVVQEMVNTQVMANAQEMANAQVMENVQEMVNAQKISDVWKMVSAKFDLHLHQDSLQQ